MSDRSVRALYRGLESERLLALIAAHFSGSSLVRS